MAKKTGYITALYERLSRDDEQFGDSTSIVNQKKMLETYAREHDYTNIRHYTDDGYSGGSFDRPGWNEMIKDVEDGKISTVIVKDMSRVGRNYLEVGYYTEVYFSQKDIRFIAISNNVDSEDQTSSEFAPFLNIMNEWYLRDCSNKIKATKRSMGNAGVHLATIPCYGYKKDPNDKHKWVIDEEAAEVVRLIFRLCIEGLGTTQIAHALRDRKIVTPSYHAALNNTGRFKNNIEALEPYNWSSGSIKNILCRPDYIGYTVNFKSHNKSYKEKKNIKNSPDQWAVFEGTQEPIIDRYTYQLAQKLIGTPRRHDTLGEANPLTGLVFCADCGAKMYNHRAKPFVDRYGKKQPGFDGYDCSLYKLSYRKTSGLKCFSHHISTKALRELVLYVIQSACKNAITDREEFVKKVQTTAEQANSFSDDAEKNTYSSNKKRYQELDHLYKKAYESYASGLIKENKFIKISQSYEAEQEKVSADIREYEEKQEARKDWNNDMNYFFSLVDKYTSIEKLTPQILNEFVDKILVHKAEKIDGRRVQKVEIYLNGIGKIEISEPEKSPEQEKIDQYWREKYQRRREYELNLRKKNLRAADAIVRVKEEKEKQRLIDEFNNDVKTGGLERMPVIPERLMQAAT